ncbi:hypothetical protein DICPUDRAFT_21416, partial [Dictyostelium purpureum]
FDKWNYTKINNSTSEYKTILGNIVNITTTIQWFEKMTNISFANQNLIMNPSSLKYTIEIKKYPFESPLNHLQLILSAELESNNDGSCSEKDFGETSTGDNSDYIKIQIDKVSLYGRFIKRGIIDSKISPVTNTLLDSDLNSIQTNSKSQSYVGINVNYFNERVYLDPDFSVLLNGNSVSNSKSICKSNNKLS